MVDKGTDLAGGQISMNGTASQLSCLVDGLLAMSLDDDADDAIVINGASTDTYGIVYAPNGGVVYNAAAQEVHHGGIVGRRINFNGSDCRFACSHCDYAAPSHVRLIK